MQSLTPKLNEKTFKFLHLSDTHFSYNYKEGSNANCGLDSCCYDGENVPIQDQAKYWGTIANCDLPLRTIEATFKWIKENLDFDFIIWTGDNADHAQWKQTAPTQAN